MKILNKAIYAMCALTMFGVCCNTDTVGDRKKSKSKSIGKTNAAIPLLRIAGETNIKFVYYSEYKEFEITNNRDREKIKNTSLDIVRAIIERNAQYFIKQVFSGNVTFTYIPYNGAQSRSDHEKMVYVKQMLLDVFDREIVSGGVSLHEALVRKKRITIEMSENMRSVRGDKEFVMLFVRIKNDDDNVEYSFGFLSNYGGGAFQMVLSDFSINIGDSIQYQNTMRGK